jgi:hypothetical protein
MAVKAITIEIPKALVGVPTDHSLKRGQQFEIESFSSLATTK